MKELKDIQYAYFIGIGGIGMSAVARYFNHLGMTVSGYDRTETVLTKQLVEEGIEVRYELDAKQIPAETELVVFTPAIPADQEELVFCRAQNWPVLKRSEVLQLITQTTFTIAVAGTHGKTSVTSMIAHLLTHSGFGCTAFVGGIMKNYQSNYIQGKKEVVVVEADEYDRSFLRLNPNVAVITAMDADHLDIYGDAASVEKSFLDFAQLVDKDGMLVVKKGLSAEHATKEVGVTTYHYGDQTADCYAKNLKIVDGSYEFDLQLGDKTITNCQLNMGGRHNVENAIAASSIANHIGLDTTDIQEALQTFQGIERRFDYIMRDERLVVIDDYAHHPAELTAVITSIQELYPAKKIAVMFQPHLYSRTRDFAEGFAESLSLADVVFLMDIYPARELPIPGVSSAIIFDRLSVKEKQMVKPETMLDVIESMYFDIFLIVGAGDISHLVPELKKHFSKKYLLS